MSKIKVAVSKSVQGLCKAYLTGDPEVKGHMNQGQRSHDLWPKVKVVVIV